MSSVLVVGQEFCPGAILPQDQCFTADRVVRLEGFGKSWKVLEGRGGSDSFGFVRISTTLAQPSLDLDAV